MTRPLVPAAAARSADGTRRSEILEIAASLFAASGYVRTSLKDVADACGILPGSLYHHFDSKESIAIELLVRYQAELDEIGRAYLAELEGPPSRPTVEHVRTLGTAIAGCAVRHGAALQLSTYQPHAGAAPILVELARREPAAVTTAMQRILDAGQTRAEVRPGVDVALLARQLCENMLHVGLASLHRDAPPDQTAALLCAMLMSGIATRPPANRVLDRSAARAAVVAAVEGWSEQAEEDLHDRKAALRAVARIEFARRGNEATTIRDIAAAAAMGNGSVYRLVESKEALLVSIMNWFHHRLSSGYEAVAAAPGTAIEKLDALIWLNINALERFAEEFAIQRSWFRSFPPATRSLADSFEQRTTRIRDIVTAGVRDGEIRFEDTSPQSLTLCVRDLIWIPPVVVRQTDKRDVLSHSRATLLRGAATPAGRAS